MLSLSNPQNIYLNGLNTKYRAYVGGFGCVHPDTKIWTEHGLMPISKITDPVRVLSWNENDQRFQLSISGGAYPKGKANLYRVVTQQGEFVASGHHRSLCADGKYRQVSDLRVGNVLSSCEPYQPQTTVESALRSLPSDAQHYSEIIANLMGDYADAARQYGQQLLAGLMGVAAFAPSPAYVQKYGQISSLNDCQESGLRHIHQGQPVGLQATPSFLLHAVRLVNAWGDQISSLFAERTLGYLRESQQSLSRFAGHHKDRVSLADDHSYSCSLIKSASIITHIEIQDNESEYWDMQVLDTNNYITEDGVIHHNSGKTFVGCLDLLIFFSQHPGTVQGYFGPTYPAIRDIFYPTFEEAAELMGFSCVIREANKEIHIYRNGNYYGTVICRSMDNPASIIGFKISRALVDEIDVLAAKKADLAWNKIVARLRLVIDGVQNSIGVTTTPEGFKWAYNKFANNPTESYSMVQASTYENEMYLPPDYIDTLKETYPDQLITAYLNGDFVNLTSGTVYRSYDRIKHRSHEAVKGGESVFVGMDFNIDKMAATVYVLRGEAFHAVDQVANGYNTPAVADILESRYPNNKKIIYPDSSGKNRTRMGGVSESDIAILRNEYKFECRYKPTNPAVKDRVNATNKAFEDGRLFVNDKACPDVAACFEQQVYNEQGEPDKSAGNDHQNDASTYPIAYELPIVKPVTNIRIGKVS